MIISINSGQAFQSINVRVCSCSFDRRLVSEPWHPGCRSDRAAADKLRAHGQSTLTYVCVDSSSSWGQCCCVANNKRAKLLGSLNSKHVSHVILFELSVFCPDALPRDRRACCVKKYFISCPGTFIDSGQRRITGCTKVIGK